MYPSIMKWKLSRTACLPTRPSLATANSAANASLRYLQHAYGGLAAKEDCCTHRPDQDDPNGDQYAHERGLNSVECQLLKTQCRKRSGSHKNNQRCLHDRSSG